MYLVVQYAILISEEAFRARKDHVRSWFISINGSHRRYHVHVNAWRVAGSQFECRVKMYCTHYATRSGLLGYLERHGRRVGLMDSMILPIVCIRRQLVDLDRDIIDNLVLDLFATVVSYCSMYSRQSSSARRNLMGGKNYIWRRSPCMNGRYGRYCLDIYTWWIARCIQRKSIIPV